MTTILRIKIQNMIVNIFGVSSRYSEIESKSISIGKAGEKSLFFRYDFSKYSFCPRLRKMTGDVEEQKASLNNFPRLLPKCMNSLELI